MTAEDIQAFFTGASAQQPEQAFVTVEANGRELRILEDLDKLGEEITGVKITVFRPDLIGIEKKILQKVGDWFYKLCTETVDDVIMLNGTLVLKEHIGRFVEEPEVE